MRWRGALWLCFFAHCIGYSWAAAGPAMASGWLVVVFWGLGTSWSYGE